VTRSIIEQFLYIQSIGYIPAVAIDNNTMFVVVILTASFSSEVFDIFIPHFLYLKLKNQEASAI
jgi:hypothetical protein